MDRLSPAFCATRLPGSAEDAAAFQAHLDDACRQATLAYIQGVPLIRLATPRRLHDDVIDHEWSLLLSALSANGDAD